MSEVLYVQRSSITLVHRSYFTSIIYVFCFVLKGCTRPDEPAFFITGIRPEPGFVKPDIRSNILLSLYKQRPKSFLRGNHKCAHCAVVFMPVFNTENYERAKSVNDVFSPKLVCDIYVGKENSLISGIRQNPLLNIKRELKYGTRCTTGEHNIHIPFSTVQYVPCSVLSREGEVRYPVPQDSIIQYVQYSIICICPMFCGE